MHDRVERWASGCFWIFGLVGALGTSVPFAVIAVAGDDPDQRIAGAVIGAVMALAVPAILVGVAYLRLSLKRRPWVIELIDALGDRLGGTPSGPTLGRVAGQWRLEAVVDGVRVRVTLLRQGGMHGRTWMAEVSASEPIGFRVAVSTSRALLAPRGALVGLDAFEVGDPALDDAYEYLSNAPERARRVLLDPVARPLWESLMRRPGEPLLNLSDQTALSEGATLRMGIGDETTADDLAEVARTLIRLGRAAAAA